MHIIVLIFQIYRESIAPAKVYLGLMVAHAACVLALAQVVQVSHIIPHRYIYVYVIPPLCVWPATWGTSSSTSSFDIIIIIIIIVLCVTVGQQQAAIISWHLLLSGS